MPSIKSSKYKFLLLFILLISHLSIFAQQRGNFKGQKAAGMAPMIIKGKIIDGISSQHLEYATISILSKRDSTLITGGISDEKGNFALKSKIPAVIVKLEYLGFETLYINPPFEKGNRLIDLGEIILNPTSEILENVEIVADKSESQFYLDKQVFNVGKDLVNQGGTAEDILDNVPSVSVDIEGVVSLRGSTGVRMLIDGKPSGLIGDDNSGLRTIPANLISRIEVITNPSARYEAEGMAGIINIVLKKNKGSGFNGSLDLNTGYPIRAGFGANLNYRKDKLNWFLNYGFNYRESEGGGFNYQERLTENGLFITDNNRDIGRSSLSHSFRFGADYFLSDKEQLTGAFLYKTSDDDNLSTIDYLDYAFENESELLRLNTSQRKSLLDNNTLSSYTIRTDNEIEDESNLEYSLNYTREFSNKDHKLSALIQFSDRSEIEGSDLDEEIFNNQNQKIGELFQRSNNDEGNNTWLFQTDYSHAFSREHKWEVGLRASLRDITNKFLVEDLTDDEWVPKDGLNNDFIYNEDIYASYLIYGNTLNKFSYQFGTRFEYADIRTELFASEQNGINKRDFLNLFPSGHLNYKFNEINAAQLSYSRRVRRPRFWSLNPFFTFSDNRNFFSGNPNIDPEYTDSYEISNIYYWDKMSLTGSLFYRHTRDAMQRMSFFDVQEFSTVSVPLNIGEVNDIGLDVNFSHHGIKWLRLDANVSIYNNKITIDDERVQDEVFDYYFIIRSFTGTEEELLSRFTYEVNDTDNLRWNTRLTARITLFNSDLQLRGRYRGPSDSTQGRNKAMASLDIGWSKDLAKDFTLTFSARDVFNSRKRMRITEFSDFYSNSEFQWMARSFTLTANYRINQKKSYRRPQNGSGGAQGEF